MTSKMTSEHEIISREEAREAGLTHYYTGVPCRKGHDSVRYVSTGLCRQCRLDAKERYKEKDLKRHKAQKRRQYLNNKQYYRDWESNYRKTKRNNDPNYRLRMHMRTSLRRILRITDNDKTDATYSVVGYDNKTLREHLESLFIEGMTWDNYGEWHIDHIRPISRMVEEGVTDPAKINALSNLAPLWALHNSQKADLTVSEWWERYPEMATVYPHLKEWLD